MTGIADLDQFSQTFLDAPVPEPKPGHRFSLVGWHLNPSAERLFVFSSDFRLVRELYGWEIVTLPSEAIVYHQSQVHFAPTHTLEISVFDPIALIDRQIYPPAVADTVRRNFIERVSNAYEARGAAWFRENNHHMDATRFDSSVIDGIIVDESADSMTFQVAFGDPDNARDPLPFSERAQVTCTPLAPVDRIRCREAPAQ